MSTTIKLHTARVWVSTYNTYNSGSLLGEWVDLYDFTSSNEFYTHLSEVLNKKLWKEQDPEYMFNDFEGFPRSLYYESYVSDDIFLYLDIISREGVDEETFSGFIDNWGYTDLEEGYQKYKDCKTGFDDWQEYAEDYADIYYPEAVKCGYFDYKSLIHELKFDHTMIKGYIFRDN